MLGTVVNTVAVIVGSLIGLLLHKGIPQRLVQTIMCGIGLCVIGIGISGFLKGDNTLVQVLSVAIGAVIGELLDLDKRVNQLGQWVERKFTKTAQNAEEMPENALENKHGSISEGFVTAGLLFCVGSMAIVGSLQSGISGNHEMLFTKSLLDFISAIVFSASLGVGVMLSAAAVFIYQGAITLLAQFIAPYLTEAVIAEMTAVGSILIIGLGLNLIHATKLKVMNYIPAIFLPILLCWLWELF